MFELTKLPCSNKKSQGGTYKLKGWLTLFSVLEYGSSDVSYCALSLYQPKYGGGWVAILAFTAWVTVEIWQPLCAPYL
jgi:hypothetical protein